MKDIAAEKFKNARDSLDRSSTQHLNLSYNLFVQDNLASVKQSADLTLSMLQCNGKTQFNEYSTKALIIRIAAASDHAKVLNEYTRSLSRLIEQLPQQNEKKITATMLVKKSNKLLDEVNSLVTRISSLAYDNRCEPSTSWELSGNIDTILDETKPIMEEANDLTWSFVNDLAFQKQKVQKDYEFTIELSHIFFALGWVIGLVSQILPKDNDTPNN